MYDKLRIELKARTAHLDATAKDIHQGLPLKIFGILAKSRPVTPCCLRTVVVLSFFDLPGLLVAMKYHFNVLGKDDDQ